MCTPTFTQKQCHLCSFTSESFLVENICFLEFVYTSVVLLVLKTGFFRLKPDRCLFRPRLQKVRPRQAHKAGDLLRMSNRLLDHVHQGIPHDLHVQVNLQVHVSIRQGRRQNAQMSKVQITDAPPHENKK